MSDAESYYQSLLQQGYDVNQATVYTKEHYPHFVDPMASQPAAPAGAAPAASGTDPMMMMMMMNQQNQQSQQSQQAAMMQQQALLAQSQMGQSQQPQQVVYMSNPMNSGNKTSNTGYLLWLCCFLGLAGIHRFYYGRTLSGIVYLFTFGLFGFGQLYDLLIMPELARTAK
jgi:hypothetical protein